jgi:benzoyl-CoA reductase/2-hydroxyglutaryl-CoA dehydratase subunit BcrC/BadD/HgdB
VTSDKIRKYLGEQRVAKGRPTVLAFPALYPREILTALGLCAWEQWAPREPSSAGAAGGKMQPYLCPTVRGAHALLAAGEHGACAVVVPHTCDSMQGLATLGRDMGACSVPVVPFRHPRGPDRPSARVFLRAEVLAFAAELGRAVDRELDPSRLAAAIELHRRVERSLARVLAERARLAASDAELYATLREWEWMHPEDFALRVEALEQRIDPGAARRPGVPLLVSGMVPEPEGFFEALEQAGGWAAADDYAAVGRRLPAHGEKAGADPVGCVVDRLLSTAPCPTRYHDASARVAHLVSRARRAGAAGVVLHTVKFCEPELFDVPLMRGGLEKAGLKVLHVETELEQRVPGQIATRLEAFCEMLSRGGEAGAGAGTGTGTGTLGEERA